MIVVGGKVVPFLNGGGSEFRRPPPPPRPYYNPGDILTIEPAVIPKRIDFSEGAERLHTQFDRMLSDKKNFLSIDRDFIEQARPYQEAFVRGLEDLKESGWNTVHIQPIIIAMSELQSKTQDALLCKESGSFDALAHEIVKLAFEVNFKELELFIAMYQWAGMSTDSLVQNYETTRNQMAQAGYVPPSPFNEYSGSDPIHMESLGDTVDDLLRSLNRKPVTEESEETPTLPPVSLAEDESEMRKVTASIVNHRIGNMPGGTTYFQSFFAPGTFNEPYEGDRQECAAQTAVRIFYLSQLQFFIDNPRQCAIHSLTEWAQFRMLTPS